MLHARTTRVAFALGLFFLGAPTASARTVTVSGNERTSTTYIEHYVQRCERAVEPEVAVQAKELAAAVRQCLLNSQLFSDVRVEADAQSLRIAVEERWTLIPLPFVTVSSSGERSSGLYLLESNFLGRGQLLVLGGSVSSRGNGYFAYFQDKSLFFTPWSLGLVASRTQSEILSYGSEARGEEVDPLTGFRESKVVGSAALGYEITPGLSVGTDLVRSVVETATLKDHGLDPGDRSSVTTVLRARYDRTDYKLYFNEGVTVAAAHAQQVARSDAEDKSRQSTFTAMMSGAVFGDHAVRASVFAGEQKGGDVADLFRLGNKPGFRGIRSDAAWVRSYGAMSLDYMVPLKSYESGTWTVGSFAEGGHLRVWREGGLATLDYGTAGVGSYYYLKKIALPGVGFEIGHNTKFQSLFASVSAGMSLN